MTTSAGGAAGAAAEEAPEAVVVVGAGAAGLAVVESLRRNGHRGPLVLVGEEGSPPYDRPPLSKRFLTGAAGARDLQLRGAEALAALDVDLRLGVRATRLDAAARSVSLSDGGSCSYDALVVATGVRPRRLPGTDPVRGVHVLRTVDDAAALRAELRPGRRLVVVGAGFLGSEVAATAQAMGLEVTLLARGDAPLAATAGTEVGELLARVHRAQGTEVRTGAQAQGLACAGGAVSAVVLADGSEVPADLVLVAVGSDPATGWLDDSGLPLDDGLVCDERCSAAPGVWAVGDVARWHNPLFGRSMRLEHRTNASEQALAVARNLLAPRESRPFAPVPYLWSDQHHLRVQAHGDLRDHEEAVVVEQDRSEDRLLVAYRRGDRVTGVLGVGTPPAALRGWRRRVQQGAAWEEALDHQLVP